MHVNPRDGVCRTCADDATMTVECQNPECGDSYPVEPDALGDGCMIYYLDVLTSGRRDVMNSDPVHNLMPADVLELEMDLSFSSDHAASSFRSSPASVLMPLDRKVIETSRRCRRRRRIRPARPAVRSRGIVRAGPVSPTGRRSPPTRRRPRPRLPSRRQAWPVRCRSRSRAARRPGYNRGCLPGRDAAANRASSACSSRSRPHNAGLTNDCGQKRRSEKQPPRYR